MSEEWVPCYEAENYEVSDEGHVRNVKTGKLLKPDIDVYGRAIITLRINGRNCRKRIHRLMFESFYGPEECEGLDVYHIDGDKENNRLDNLAAGSRSETMQNWFSTQAQDGYLKRVLCVETGEIFNSISECAASMNMSRSAVSKSLNMEFCGNRNGYHFEWVD